ncbi:MAG: M20/M25/M40 family metallo-hydrolase [Lachnospiraceae bacterium]|nr:M20/M25/M40 family metallo-hydrolase [Lachnospiraceae bacterium]
MTYLETAVRHLSEAITFRTISNPDDTKTDWNEFFKFHDWLKATYPLTHNTLKHEVVGKASMLYKWSGKSDSLRPFALLAHMDVVPVEESTLKDWTHPPFDGFADEKTIWGRGAADMKNQLVAIFETVERLLSENYTPDRDIYICLGHNEEVQIGEGSGAKEIARLLRERGIHFEFILDEGGAVTDSSFFGLKSPTAMIGLAEKGYADIRVTVSGEGGHAAEPPAHTALGNLALLITAIEANPMKQRLIEPVISTLNTLAHHSSFLLRLASASKRLLKPFIFAYLARDRQTNAMTRTTIAVTMSEASPAANVLPQKASALFNVRILPGDSIEKVVNHFKKIAFKTFRNKTEVKIEVLKSAEPAELQKLGQAYELIRSFLPSIITGVIPVPYLVTGATDSHEYTHITDEIYRFYPFVLSEDEINSMHATDERIRLKSLAGALRFNYQFIKKAGEK